MRKPNPPTVGYVVVNEDGNSLQEFTDGFLLIGQHVTVFPVKPAAKQAIKRCRKIVEQRGYGWEYRIDTWRIVPASAPHQS